MTKISNISVTTPSLTDLLVGTDTSNSNMSANFQIGEILMLGDFVVNGYFPVLNAVSTAASQVTSTEETPIQIEFGAAQNSGTDEVMIDINGVLTFNEPGVYLVEEYLQVQKVAGVGDCILHHRALLDDVQYGQTKTHILIDNLIPFTNRYYLNVETVGLEMKIQIATDDTTTLQGGVFRQVVSSGLGWTNSPCAALKVYKVGFNS
jgi:hypothetical protein